ncbi:MAG: hypothetical protein ACLVJO_03980 [[Clostridium] scindens]
MGGGDRSWRISDADHIAGQTYCCMGTSAWIDDGREAIFDAQMRTVTWAHVIPGMYAPNGTMQYAGGHITG